MLPENESIPETELDEVRRRIRKKLREQTEALQRASRRIAVPAPQGDLQAIRYRRDVPGAQAPRRPWHRTAGPPVRLEEAAAGSERAAPGGGVCYYVEADVAETEPEGRLLCRNLENAFDEPFSPLRAQLDASGAIEEPRPEDAVFFDLETAGLSTAPLFLIGAMVWENGRLNVKQYLARDYSEERAVLEMFADLCAGKRLFVTFNGKSFDVPFVAARAALHGVAFACASNHLDLLHVGRRAWRGQFPNCKLQTLERYVCGRMRQGDIPGCEIPDAYHAFVRTGDAVEMVEVLKHNYLDLVTLAELIVRLP